MPPGCAAGVRRQQVALQPVLLPVFLLLAEQTARSNISFKSYGGLGSVGPRRESDIVRHRDNGRHEVLAQFLAKRDRWEVPLSLAVTLDTH